MVRFETTLLDKFVNGAFAGKRKIGRALKPNLRSRGSEGWIELVFNPRNRFEQYISQAIRFVHPYLFFVSYRFHVEKARESGKQPIQLLSHPPHEPRSTLQNSLQLYSNEWFSKPFR